MCKILTNKHSLYIFPTKLHTLALPFDKNIYFLSLCVQHSDWLWDDGSPVPSIDWGLTQMNPYYSVVNNCGTNDAAACSKSNHKRPSTYSNLYAIGRSTRKWSAIALKEHGGKEDHCSAFAVSPDLSHVSLIPVNCTVKQWNRVLCVDGSNNNSVSSLNNVNLKGTQRGQGEYLVSQNMLLQTKYLCPAGYNIVVQNVCTKLILMKTDRLRHTKNYGLFKLYQYGICSMENSKSFASIHTEGFGISTINPIYGILEQYFSEGSQLVLNHEVINPDEYIWYPDYPTYIPCFTARELTPEAQIDISMKIFECEDGSVIPEAQMCNGISNCRNSEDEQNCSVCSLSNPELCYDECEFPDCVCNMFYYQCKAGGCVHYDNVCDSYADCPNGDDETLCQFINFNESFIVESYITDVCNPPSGDMQTCRSKPQCYNSSAICHYDHSGGVMAYCEDGSHLGKGNLCKYVECPKQYKCQGAYCIPIRKVCDGITDCPVGDDEASCVNFSCPRHMRCTGTVFCVPPHEICDGIAHCPKHEDEKYCQMCPEGCQCKGTVVYCQNILRLSLSGNLQFPSALVLHNSFPVFESLYSEYWSKMQYVRMVNLRGGTFAYLLGNRSSISQSFLSVKVLYLNHQVFSVLPPNFIHGQNMTHVDLSHNVIYKVKKHAFGLMTNVRILSIASNKLQTLEEHVLNDLKMLTHMYLNDNPLMNIAPNVFVENSGLVLIRSDWYMMCCVAIGTQDCQPQNQFVSSCSNLIASTIQRVAILTQGIIVITGNIAALVIQVGLIHCNTPTADKYLIVSLTIADLMMGLYLLAITVVDLSYTSIFYKIVSEWTSNVPCMLFGLINFISSEVSLVILSILSLARMISIDKIGGMALMKSRIHMACIAAWLVILISGILYAVYIFTHNMKLRNNMCIILGISDQRFVTYFERMFQIVFICINMLLVLTMTLCMLDIFRTVTKYNRTVEKLSNPKLQEKLIRQVGFRLLLLVVCNVLTWVPFLLVSILMVSNVAVHESVLQWVVVLCLPLCASTDPVLYNLATIKAYINKIKDKLFSSST